MFKISDSANCGFYKLFKGVNDDGTELL